MLHEFLDKTYRQSANKQESQEARFARTMQVFESIVGFLQDPLEFPN